MKILKWILLGGAIGVIYDIIASFAMDKGTMFGYVFQFLLYPPYYLLRLFCLFSVANRCPANDFGDIFLMALLVVIFWMILGGIIGWIKYRN
jgi:hypothetical protein